MQTYILILIGILVLLLIGVVYFGWRKIINLEIESNKNKYDIEALRGLLSKLLDGDEIEMNPSYYKKDKPYNIQMNNANELKNKQFGGEDEDESNVDTLQSSDDEEKIPEDESTVSIENIEDEDDSDEDDEDDEDEDDEDDSDEDDEDDSDEDDSDEDDSDEDVSDEETEETDKEEKEEKEVEKEYFPEPEVKEIKHEEEKTEDKNENSLEDNKSEVKVIVIEKKKDDEVSKSVKKIPSESLKNYKAGDVVVSKNDGNKYKVVMYKNQKKWKLIDE